MNPSFPRSHRLKKYCIYYFGLLFTILSGCQLFNGGTPTDWPEAKLSDKQHTQFIPIDPIAYEEYFEEELEYYDLDDNNEITRDEELLMFANESVQIRVKQFDAAGNVSFPIAAISMSGGHYEVYVDYAKYRTDRTDEYIIQSGIGIRMKANIFTLESGLDVSNLYGIAAAAEQKKLSGTLRFETIGIGGKQISTLIPLPSEISMQSIMNSMQAAAAIKSNLYDIENVKIYPQVFAYKKMPSFELSDLRNTN